jgi:hypothetical protein
MDNWDIGCGTGHGSHIGGSGIMIPSAKADSYENPKAIAKKNIDTRYFFIFQPLSL